MRDSTSARLLQRNANSSAPFAGEAWRASTPAGPSGYAAFHSYAVIGPEGEGGYCRTAPAAGMNSGKRCM